jgi:hypothetical protein
MASISLIVRGDYFGLSHAANQAICEAFDTGLLNCASLVVPGPWLAEAVALAHDHPEWEIGLQLLLESPTAAMCLGPVCGASSVATLVGPRGVFYPTLPETASAADIDRELSAQVERAKSWGISPAYLEYTGSNHSAVQTAMRRLSEQHGIPADMTSWGIGPLPSLDSMDEAFAASFAAILATLGAGTHLWVTHPAPDSPETWALWPNRETAERHHRDSQNLCDPAVRRLLKQSAIECISFRQHLEGRLGTEAEE